MEGAFKPAQAIGREERKAEWARYYSEKRIHEQLLQVQLLRGLPIHRVLEIGPYYGLVTAMLDNAGYEVTTMDSIERSFERPDRPHIRMDLAAVDAARLKGFDCIMCCATLEHVLYEQAAEALRAFRESGVPYVLISVPYQGPQLYFQLYVNGFTFAQRFAFKKLRFLRRFRFDPAADPHGHKWEIGYKGRSLRAFEAMLRGIGFRILRRAFSYPSFAVFHVLENRA